eukprot:m.16457 g.16457  ORF g.16457 m.16457 type:complete len:399 (-) comp5256_c0_seq2:215-1411(-)
MAQSKAQPRRPLPKSAGKSHLRDVAHTRRHCLHGLREVRHDLKHLAGNAACAQIAVGARHHGDLLCAGQRGGNLGGDTGNRLENHVHNGGILVQFPGGCFFGHGLGFSLGFFGNGKGFGLTLGADALGLGLSLHDGPVLLGRGQGLRLKLASLGRALLGGFKLTLGTRNFLFHDLNLTGTFDNLLTHLFVANGLLRLGFLQSSGKICLGLFGVDLHGKLGLLDLKVALGKRNIGLVGKLGGLFLLLGLCLPDASVTLVDGFTDACVTLNLRSSCHTQGSEVALCVCHVTDRVRHNSDSHVHQIPRGNFKHSLGKLLAILVDLLDSHLTHNGALVAFECLKSNVCNLTFSAAKKLLAGCVQHGGVGSFDLDLGDTGDGNRNAERGVDARRLNVERHHVE